MAGKPRQVVIVDSREPMMVKLAVQAQLNDEVEFVALPEADFMLPDVDTHLLGIERKTVSDFISSIQDGRLVKQLTRMRETYNMQGLIVEGRYTVDPDGKITVDGHHTRWSHASFQMVVWSVQRNNPDLGMWWTNDLGETADLIRAVANKGSQECFTSTSLFGDPHVDTGPHRRVPAGARVRAGGIHPTRAVKAPGNGRRNRVVGRAPGVTPA